MADTKNKQAVSDQPKSRMVGLLAQFDNPESLISAGTAAREAGYRKLDAYTPFPVHGIDEAIGIKRTVLPFIVLAIGLSACVGGLFLQYYTNSTDESPIFPGYKYLISGKPLFSLPANIPVTFEIIVLSSAFTAFLGMWALNGLPRLANPLHRVARFRRATNDKFFLLLEAKDEKFDGSRSRQQLEEWGAEAIEECHEDLTDHEFPKVVKLVGLTLLFVLMLPPVLIFRSYGMVNRSPRLHFNPDMDWQDKFKTQTEGPAIAILNKQADHSSLFGDGRSMRDPIPGTIAIGMLQNDLEIHRGYDVNPASVAGNFSSGSTRLAGQFSLEDNEPKQDGAAAPAVQSEEPEWATTFPDDIVVDMDTLLRGKKRFEIYCSVCHGYTGAGDGLVNQRAVALSLNAQAAWTTAKSLHDPTVISQPVGRIFDTITNGRGTMGPYKSQIPYEDRWAIVLYVKTLQEMGFESPEATAATTEKPAGN